LTPRARRKARKELRRPVRRAARRLARSVEAARIDGAHDAWHQARKDAKRARYTADVARPVFGAALSAWRKRIKALQTELGEHQDAAVALPLLRELGVRAHLQGGNGFTYGLLHGRQAAYAADARHRGVDRWHAVTTGTRPAWLR
ncbi:MAG TPA: CHAD domain-containing protein, partial [Pseudonocardiaceae bacterium]